MSRKPMILALVCLLVGGCSKKKSDDDIKKQIAKNNVAWQAAAEKFVDKVKTLEGFAAATAVSPPTAAPAKRDDLDPAHVELVHAVCLGAAFGGTDAKAKALCLASSPDWLTAAVDVRRRAEVVTGDVKALAPLEALRYLAVITTSQLREPAVSTAGFEPGAFAGVVSLVDLTTGETLGGGAITATSSEKVEYTEYQGQGGTPEGDPAWAVKVDLIHNIEKAARVALGAP